MPDPLITLAQVAERLGVPLSRLHRTIRTLREQHGFPQPVPLMGGRYDPLAIDEWRAGLRGAFIFPPSHEAAKMNPPPIDPGADPYADERATLLDRAAGLGRRNRAA